LDIGVRVTALRDVSFLAAVDFTLQRQVAIGIQTLPEWELSLGIAYNFDLFAQNKVTIVERAGRSVEAPAAPTTGFVIGTVLEQDTRAPIPGALIQATQAPGLVATDSSGHFQTHALPLGPVDLTATRDGYKPGVSKALVLAGQPVTAEILMQRETRPATISISVHGADKPVAAAVSVTGVDFAQDVKLADNGQGQVAVGKPGSYTLKVSAEGFLSQLRKVDVAAGATVPVDIGLSATPKQTDLIITDKKIRLRRQIHFENGKSTILPDSTSILEEVLDAMLAKNVSKLRIEGHTDTVGTAPQNLQLSQDRANAVMQWLIEHGVAADKLEAVGYGDTHPMAPNLTARGRALNRRVEFDIL
jgi:OOP family OmpA-OmpF porin